MAISFKKSLASLFGLYFNAILMTIFFLLLQDKFYKSDYSQQFLNRNLFYFEDVKSDSHHPTLNDPKLLIELHFRELCL